MYGKIFELMYDGTIAANWKALVTFQQMIVLADSQGIIDITPPALAKRTGIPLEIIEDGIIYLSKPDPYSRTRVEEGRRISLLDDHRPWGWRIVNYKHYRDLATRAEKSEYDKIRYSAKKGGKSDENSEKAEIPQDSTDSTYVDVDVDADKHTKRFSKPTIKAITRYCEERKNNIGPNNFFDYYETRGWILKSGQKMKCWKAAIRTWEKNNKKGKVEYQ